MPFCLIPFVRPPQFRRRSGREPSVHVRHLPGGDPNAVQAPEG